MSQNTSYLWWQLNGSGWSEEILDRKTRQIYYHIQELLLLDYFQGAKFNRVLEFGCGFGRHLSYLREIPGLEIFGYDQSESMLSHIYNWADNEWISKYIKLGEPKSPLPYRDKYFDAVFTTSVLIHIPPEDIVGVLKELIKVAKYQIIHQEPAPNYQVYQPAHDGCWNHDLVELYSSLGYTCEILEPGFEIQRLYRIILNNQDQEKLYTPSKLLCRKLYDLEKNIQPSLDLIDAKSSEGNISPKKYEQLVNERNYIVHQCDRLTIERNDLAQKCDHLTIERNDLTQKCDHLTIERNDLAQKCDRLTVERNDLAQTCDRLTVERNDLAQKCDRLTIEKSELTETCDRLTTEKNDLAHHYHSVNSELNEILNSRTWQAILKIKSNSYIKSVGRLAFNIIQGIKGIKPQAPVNIVAEAANFQPVPYVDQDMENWLKSLPTNDDKKTIAVYVPNWLGINSATQNMFPYTHPLAEILNEDQVEYYTNLFITHDIKHIIFAGISPSQIAIIRAIYQKKHKIRCDVTWHASYVQNCEDFGWSMMTQAIDMGKTGMIHKFGVAKKGMEETFRSMGLCSDFLPNFVDKIPDLANTVDSKHIELGIWLSWTGYRKLPYAMIASANLVPNAAINMAGVGERAKEWADMLGLNINYYSCNAIPREELYKRIKNTHLTLYLTSSECAPMLPIESLSLGVPCLISPVSHWFEDDNFLHSRLVVPYPERPEIIAQYITQALEDRDKIIARYKIYAERYNNFAKEQVQKFLHD